MQGSPLQRVISKWGWTSEGDFNFTNTICEVQDLGSAPNFNFETSDAENPKWVRIHKTAVQEPDFLG